MSIVMPPAVKCYNTLICWLATARSLFSLKFNHSGSQISIYSIAVNAVNSNIDKNVQLTSKRMTSSGPKRKKRKRGRLDKDMALLVCLLKCKTPWLFPTFYGFKFQKFNVKFIPLKNQKPHFWMKHINQVLWWVFSCI